MSQSFLPGLGPLHFPPELPDPVHPFPGLITLQGPPSIFSTLKALLPASVKSVCCPSAFIHVTVPTLLTLTLRSSPPKGSILVLLCHHCPCRVGSCPRGPFGPSQVCLSVSLLVLPLGLSSMGTHISKKRAILQSQRLSCVPSFLITLLWFFFLRLAPQAAVGLPDFLKSKEGKQAPISKSTS